MMLPDDDLEQYESTAAEEILRLFSRLRPPPEMPAPQTLRTRVLTQIAQRRAPRTVRCLSTAWTPWGAGQLIAAADIPAQTEVFHLEDGEITLTCNWRAMYKETPAILQVAWRANLHAPSEIWLRFTQPATASPLAEIRLGTALVGEERFTSTELGFDPSQEAWALAIILRDLPA